MKHRRRLVLAATTTCFIFLAFAVGGLIRRTQSPGAAQIQVLLKSGMSSAEVAKALHIGAEDLSLEINGRFLEYEAVRPGIISLLFPQDKVTLLFSHDRVLVDAWYERVLRLDETEEFSLFETSYYPNMPAEISMVYKSVPVRTVMQSPEQLSAWAKSEFHREPVHFRLKERSMFLVPVASFSGKRAISALIYVQHGANLSLIAVVHVIELEKMQATLSVLPNDLDSTLQIEAEGNALGTVRLYHLDAALESLEATE